MRRASVSGSVGVEGTVCGHNPAWGTFSKRIGTFLWGKKNTHIEVFTAMSLGGENEGTRTAPRPSNSKSGLQYYPVSQFEPV